MRKASKSAQKGPHLQMMKFTATSKYSCRQAWSGRKVTVEGKIFDQSQRREHSYCDYDATEIPSLKWLFPEREFSTSQKKSYIMNKLAEEDNKHQPDWLVVTYHVGKCQDWFGCGLSASNWSTLGWGRRRWSMLHRWRSNYFVNTGDRQIDFESSARVGEVDEIWDWEDVC